MWPLQDAHHVLDEMPHRDHFSRGSILIAYNQANLPHKTLSSSPLYLPLISCSLTTSCSLASLRPALAWAPLGKANNDAYAVLDSSKFEDSVSWNAMLSAYARSGRKNVALEMFERVPTLLELGKQIHGIVIALGYESNLFISGEAQYGRAEEALAIYDAMVSAGVKPSEVTFVGLIYACSHLGLVSRGCKLFKSMTDDYGISPSLKHYTCFVDLLSLSGNLAEAENVIKAIPFKPDEHTWTILVSACKQRENTQTGIRVANQLLSLKSEDPATYILLSDVYASGAMWSMH
ncbi:hypothetical protein Patl1_26960 [Pistacia atlantica]|uniref:Uncharacterized protein n=1 Tax=Pistacia atlantica TaxID=434234 RepID=A0ACC1AZA7_9ROSI|nr:hypothetical protein Patl1_26960 [Pistacia atlantica]